MTDNSEPGRRDFLNSEDPQDVAIEETDAASRHPARPEQDEAQLSAALGKAIDQIWSELDSLQRDRETGGRVAVRLPQADVPSFLKAERPRESRRERPADFTPQAPRQRRSRRAGEEDFTRERRESTRPPWQDDPPPKNRLPAPFPQLDDLEAEDVKKRQGGPVVAGVLVAFMLAGGVLVVATNVWSLRDTVLGLMPDEGSEVVGAATTSDVAPPAPAPEPAPSRTAALPPAADEVAPPQLIEKKINGTAGAELQLGLPVPAGADTAEVRIEGLPPSARLSAGRQIAPGEWSLDAADLGALTVKTPPEAFGAFEVTAALDRGNGVNHPLGHIWLVLASPPTPIVTPTLTAEPAPMNVAAAPAEPAAPPVAVAPATETAAPAVVVEPPPPAESPPAQIAAVPPTTSESVPRGGPAPAPLSQKLSQQEIQDLLTRGTKFFSEGNMAPARLLFRRAAEAGEPLGLLLLGMTYDPVEYERRGVVGLSADEIQAMDYYEKARAAGVKDAVQRITALNNWNR